LQALPGMDNCRILLGGGTENWPQLVNLLHRSYRVLGPTVAQLAQLRSRGFWKLIAQNSGIGFPDTAVCSPPDSARSGESWLQKSSASAGGQAVSRIARREVSELHVVQDDSGNSECRSYWQREVIGRPLGAHFILYPDSVLLLGITESLSALDWPGPTEFIYRGSWGPVSLDKSRAHCLNRMADQVRLRTGLLGWLQCDLIEDLAGQLWLLELNPRWAAGMEVLQRVGINPVNYHLQAWGESSAAGMAGEWPTNARVPSVLPLPSRRAAKAVIYAQRDLALTQERIDRWHSLPGLHAADLPVDRPLSDELTDRRGAQYPLEIKAGHPVLTVLAQDSPQATECATRRRLLAELHAWRTQAMQCD
jgi:predicted ATP-grasp superfamily ATP-dependent carboligase